MLTYVLIVSPFRISFNNNSDLMNVMDSINDYVFMIDIFVNFISAYEDDEGQLNYHLNKIMKNYFFGWFFIDFVSSIPINNIMNFFDVDIKSYGTLNNLVKIIKITRLLRISKYQKNEPFEKINSMEYNVIRFMNKINLNSQIRMYMKLILMFLIFLHISGCFWHYISTLEYDNSQ
jgi:hypothetical protein